MKKFFGTSVNAVYSQIWIALITYCLLRMTQKSLPVEISLLEIRRHVVNHIYNPFSVLIEILTMPPTRASRGRRKVECDDKFNLLMRQIEVNGTGFLDTLDVELSYL